MYTIGDVGPYKAQGKQFMLMTNFEYPYRDLHCVWRQLYTIVDTGPYKAEIEQFIIVDRGSPPPIGKISSKSSIAGSFFFSHHGDVLLRNNDLLESKHN